MIASITFRGTRLRFVALGSFVLTACGRLAGDQAAADSGAAPAAATPASPTVAELLERARRVSADSSLVRQSVGNDGEETDGYGEYLIVRHPKGNESIVQVAFGSDGQEHHDSKEYFLEDGVPYCIIVSQSQLPAMKLTSRTDTIVLWKGKTLSHSHAVSVEDPAVMGDTSRFVVADLLNDLADARKKIGGRR